MSRFAHAWLVVPAKFSVGKLTITCRALDALRASRANPLHLLAAHELHALDDEANRRAADAGGSGQIDSLVVYVSVVGRHVRFARFVITTDLLVGETTMCRKRPAKSP